MKPKEARKIFKQYFDMFLPEEYKWRKFGEPYGFIKKARDRAAFCFKEVTGLDYDTVINAGEK